jgi:hypothetical protein
VRREARAKRTFPIGGEVGVELAPGAVIHGTGAALLLAIVRFIVVLA